MMQKKLQFFCKAALKKTIVPLFIINSADTIHFYNCVKFLN